MEAKQKQF
jgi:hypothetical protein